MVWCDDWRISKERKSALRIKYLGTGAAEGIPALFCHCSICQQARSIKGRNVRTRAQALIDNELLLDFGPDTYMHALMYDLELADIYHCLVTHTHDDHLYVDDLRARRRSRANLRPGTQPLTVYGGVGVEEKLKPDSEGAITKDHSVFFRKLNAGETYEIGQYSVIPLLAEHGSTEPYVYVISKSNKTILYGHDTDFFSENTWRIIKEKNLVFDLVSLDCTEGKKHIDYPGHMNFERMVHICEYMRSENIIFEGTKIIANHISHNGLVGYDEAVEIGKKHDFIVAYDGMEVDI